MSTSVRSGAQGKGSMKTYKKIKIPIVICDYCKREIEYQAHDIDGKKDYHVSCSRKMYKIRSKKE